jgi:hypothetical protein
MKKLLIAAALGLAALSATAQVSVQLGGRIAPGVYGAINLGDERPTVYGGPVVIDQDVYGDDMYLYVPYLERAHWRRYCHKYNACNHRVYFVQDQWVRDHYNREHFDHGQPDRHIEMQHREDHRVEMQNHVEERHVEQHVDHQEHHEGQGHEDHRGGDDHGHH